MPVIHHAMQYWADRPISNEKITFGLSFYGRTYDGVPAKGDGLFQPFDGGDTETYHDIRKNAESKSQYEYY